MSDEPLPPSLSASATGTGMRRRQDTLLGVLRRFSRLWGFLLFALLVVYLFRGIVLPFVFAILMAYLLAPIVARMQPRVGRVLAVILLYLLILGLITAFFGLLVPAVVQDLARLRDSLPEAIAKFNEEWLPRASAWVQTTFGAFLTPPAPVGPEAPNEVIMTPLGDGSWRVDLEGVRLSLQEQSDGSWVVGPPAAAAGGPVDLQASVRELLATQGSELTSFIGPLLQGLITGVAGFLTSFVITFMLAGFMLVDVKRVTRFARSLVPHDYRVDFEELWIGVDKGLSGVIRGQLLICVVNGVLTFIGLWVLDIKYSFLLALLAGAFSLIPIFGTIISSVPIVLIALVGSSETGLAFGPAIAVLGWIVVIHLIEANFLNPKIIGDSAQIHPVIVVFALLAGEHFYGLTGALLAVPVASIVQTMYLQARRHSAVFNDSESRA
jgi:predicted PurR-regulated permease PerM